MVSIYITTGGQWIRALEIPKDDIVRLSCRPLKWLRFACFAVLGTKGDLLTDSGPNGNIVNYEMASIADLDEQYYFLPDGDYHLVDPQGLADCITSSAHTPCCSNFRQDVSLRDGGCCVITGTSEHYTYAAHIIPHSKGDEYINFVVSERRSLYEDQQMNLPSNIGIDITENGMFVTGTIHDRFSFGDIVFLKTPNFALNPADVPMVAPGEIPTSRTTMQHLKPWDGKYAIPQIDVKANWFGLNHAPPSIFLDYMYGVAVIACFATESVQEILDSFHKTYSGLVPQIPTFPIGKNNVKSNDPKDTDCIPPGTHGISHRESAQCQAIDKAFQFSMFFKGYPGMTFEMMHQRQEEKAERHAQQVSQEKVHRWLEKTDNCDIDQL